MLAAQYAKLRSSSTNILREADVSWISLRISAKEGRTGLGSCEYRVGAVGCIVDEGGAYETGAGVTIEGPGVDTLPAGSRSPAARREAKSEFGSPLGSGATLVD